MTARHPRHDSPVPFPADPDDVERLTRMVGEIRMEWIDGRDLCGGCLGAGTRTYGDTSTWRRGCGGQAMTADVCDQCWGSGLAERPWPSRRAATPDAGPVDPRTTTAGLARELGIPESSPCAVCGGSGKLSVVEGYESDCPRCDVHPEPTEDDLVAYLQARPALGYAVADRLRVASLWGLDTLAADPGESWELHVSCWPERCTVDEQRDGSWVWTMPRPVEGYGRVRTRDEAMAAVEARLVREGIAVPPRSAP